MNDEGYVGGKKASEILNVHQRTLYQWDKKGKIETIRTPGGKRRYNVKKFIENRKMTYNKVDNIYNEDDINIDELENKIKIIYARVSSLSQANDLVNQKSELIRLYPNHKLIEDIGSGIDLNRKGLRKIIKLAIAGKIEEVVVIHKDRLTRFGYELIEDIITDYSGGIIVVVCEDQEVEPEEEIVKDVLTMMNVFVARMNGMRKYKKKKKDDK